MNVPLTTKTGIKMGSRYLENGNRTQIDDPDMLFLQEALLSTPQYRRAKRIEAWVIRLSVAGLVFIAFYSFLFR
jgi:hypothetical protein